MMLHGDVTQGNVILRFTLTLHVRDVQYYCNRGNNASFVLSLFTELVTLIKHYWLNQYHGYCESIQYHIVLNHNKAYMCAYYGVLQMGILYQSADQWMCSE